MFNMKRDFNIYFIQTSTSIHEEHILESSLRIIVLFFCNDVHVFWCVHICRFKNYKKEWKGGICTLCRLCVFNGDLCKCKLLNRTNASRPCKSPVSFFVESIQRWMWTGDKQEKNEEFAWQKWSNCNKKNMYSQSERQIDFNQRPLTKSKATNDISAVD